MLPLIRKPHALRSVFEYSVQRILSSERNLDSTFACIFLISREHILVCKVCSYPTNSRKGGVTCDGSTTWRVSEFIKASCWARRFWLTREKENGSSTTWFQSDAQLLRLLFLIDCVVFGASVIVRSLQSNNFLGLQEEADTVRSDESLVTTAAASGCPSE